LVVNGKEFTYNDLSVLVLQENKLLKEKGVGGTTQGIEQGTLPPTAFTVPQQSQGTNVPTSVRNALADISNVAANYNNI
jgi:hypothetical protein